jgi:NACHT domain
LVITWLIQGGVGPALVALPVNWAAGECAAAAKRWFRRLRRSDGLSRVLRAAANSSADISQHEFAAVRHLLEDQQTWSLIGSGTVEELATRIGACLPPRDGRAAAEVQILARAIARGLLEFAIADLDPPLFQQILLARLERLETDQASALDEAMLSLHADIAARMTRQEEAITREFSRVIRQLKQVLERLPPASAGRAEIVVYLTTLFDWMNADPWPRDRRFDGPVLTPAAIERRLQVRVKGGAQDLDADALARKCERLVVLGGPGSGKTWLAKRTARRSAEDALMALAAGASIDEVELPLYTTCSRLAEAEGDIRRAVVASALNQLSDLGGSRLSAALQLFFTERNAPTLLVIDALDEAHAPDERLRQADTLPWRLMLTSRASSWNRQLNIETRKASHRVGGLQPLRYPDDVEPFIARWFDQRPGWGEDLASQIARRPDLRQAATVPLILAFYCIIGGDRPLPEFRRDLYERVLRRMLTGRWRGSSGDEPDVDACLQTLRAWAWSAAERDPASHVGTWADDFAAPRVLLDRASREALDHIAMPIGPPDVDTGTVQRRFIHRSIREHLVAEHVAGLTVDQAAAELLFHIWYDPDWEYSAPAALAMHPRHDDVLRQLVFHAAGANQVPDDLSGFDAGWGLRRFLSRVASESDEADWSGRAAAIIGRARLDLAEAGHLQDVGVPAGWTASNGQIRQLLLDRGPLTTHALMSQWLNDVARFAVTSQERAQAREVLLGLLDREPGSFVACQLAECVGELGPTARDQLQVREVLLRLLAGESAGEPACTLAQCIGSFGPTAEDRATARQVLLALLAQTHWIGTVARLAGCVGSLGPAAPERAQVRDALLAQLGQDLISGEASAVATAMARSAVTPEERINVRQALLAVVARTNSGRTATGVVNVLARLAPAADDPWQVVDDTWLTVNGPGLTAAERGHARSALLRLLAQTTTSWAARELASAISQLGPTRDEQIRVREALVTLLAEESRGEDARMLTDAVARSAATAEDQERIREAFLAILARTTSGEKAQDLVAAIARFTVTAQDRARVRDRLLTALAARVDSPTVLVLSEAVGRLEPPAQERALVRGVLSRQLAGETDSKLITRLVAALERLGPTSDEQSMARARLLRLLCDGSSSWMAQGHAETLARLDPTPEEQARAREALLALLASESKSWSAIATAAALVSLNPALDQRRLARNVLLDLLDTERSFGAAQVLAETAAMLMVTEDEPAHVRAALLAQLAQETNSAAARGMAGLVARLGPTAGERSQARNALLRLMSQGTSATARLAGMVARLAPTAAERMQVRNDLLDLLAMADGSAVGRALAEAVGKLDPETGDRSRCRAALLALLARESDALAAVRLAGAIMVFEPTAPEQTMTRTLLLAFLGRETDASTANDLARALGQYRPSARDLTTWRAWAAPPAQELLAEARRNSRPSEWLSMLSSLPLPGAP